MLSDGRNETRAVTERRRKQGGRLRPDHMSDGYSPVSPRLTARFTVSFPVYHVVGPSLPISSRPVLPVSLRPEGPAPPGETGWNRMRWEENSRAKILSPKVVRSLGVSVGSSVSIGWPLSSPPFPLIVYHSCRSLTSSFPSLPLRETMEGRR